MRRRSRHDGRCGFTLLEVTVALALLAGAFLTVAQLLIAAARVAELSRATTLAAILAAQKLEQLRSLAWGYDAEGGPVGAPGLSPSDSLAIDSAGFVDYLDEAGGWIGSGPSPPPQALFIRRWSVEEDTGGPPAVLTLRVVVLRRSGRGVAAPAGGPSWIETARITSAKARRPS
jgi:prepilin-type N-terminal cleavage/methylation domain-containing protein